MDWWAASRTWLLCAVCSTEKCWSSSASFEIEAQFILAVAMADREGTYCKLSSFPFLRVVMCVNMVRIEKRACALLWNPEEDVSRCSSAWPCCPLVETWSSVNLELALFWLGWLASQWSTVLGYRHAWSHPAVYRVLEIQGGVYPPCMLTRWTICLPSLWLSSNAVNILWSEPFKGQTVLSSVTVSLQYPVE